MGLSGEIEQIPQRVGQEADGIDDDGSSSDKDDGADYDSSSSHDGGGADDDQDNDGGVDDVVGTGSAEVVVSRPVVTPRRSTREKRKPTWFGSYHIGQQTASCK